ncbi:MAG: extracellular solute-binding protein, partial [Sedimentisphaerales bacterium]|nr:extracellular solute-binding protein [Sedimentisphaerales bacterium]
MVGILAICLLSTVQAEIYENPDYKGEKITIRYALWGGSGEVQSAAEDCREFVRLNPDIRVDVSVYPFGQYWAKLQTQAAAALAPDVITLWEDNIGVWIERGALHQLDTFIARDEIALKDYYPAARDLCHWYGHYYALPIGVASRTLVYSIDHLEQSGIPREQWPRPDYPLTWEEFSRLARRLTLRNPDGTFAQYGMAMGHDWQWAMFRMYGGSFLDRQVDPQHSTVAGNDALKRAVVEVMQQQYADRTTMPLMALSAGNINNVDTVLLASDKYTMSMAGSWVLRELKDGGVNFGLSPMPRGTHPSQLISLNALGIFSGSKHPEAAWRFLAYKAALPAQERFGSQLKGIPALKAAKDAFIHNEFGIPDCEAYIYDLDIAVSRRAASSTYVTRQFIEWYDGLDLTLFNEYNKRLRNLSRDDNGAISKESYDQFVEGMNGFVKQTVSEKLVVIDEMLNNAFEQARKKTPSFTIKVILPAIVLGMLVLMAPLYLRWIRRYSQKQTISGRHVGWIGYLFLSPWLCGVIFFVTGPILAALLLSFTDWNMIRSPNWMGLLNYTELPNDANFVLGLKKTFLYAAWVIPISLCGGLFTAGLLTCNIRGTSVFKAIFYFPSLFTGAAAAVLWVNMFNYDNGIINYFLSFFGIERINWLDAEHAFTTVILMNIFWVGGAMIIYYAGMK